MASESRRDSVGGGGSSRMFSLMGPFLGFPKGGPGPPPLNRPLLYNIVSDINIFSIIFLEIHEIYHWKGLHKENTELSVLSL